MSAKEKLVHELKALGLITLYFAFWVGSILLVEKLMLAQYGIRFNALALALIGTILLSKVVLLMEHVPVEAWVPNQPTVVPVLLRTILYVLGVLVVLSIEKAFEARHEYGGFVRALTQIGQHPEYPRVLANTICLGWAILGYNILSALRRHLGKNGLRQLFFALPKGNREKTAPK